MVSMWSGVRAYNRGSGGGAPAVYEQIPWWGSGANPPQKLKAFHTLFIQKRG